MLMLMLMLVFMFMFVLCASPAGKRRPDSVVLLLFNVPNAEFYPFVFRDSMRSMFIVRMACQAFREQVSPKFCVFIFNTAVHLVECFAYHTTNAVLLWPTNL